MPGTTSLGIRYPLQSEIINATSWQNMSEDIDALLTSLDALRDTAVSRPTARISGGTTSVAVNTDVFMSTFNSVDWDTGGYADLGANDDRLTLPSGIFWCVTKGNISGTTTLAMARTGIVSGGATVWGMQEQDDYTSTVASTIRSSALVMLTAASTIIQARVRWSGTGGPATCNGQELAVYKVRDLADV